MILTYLSIALGALIMLFTVWNTQTLSNAAYAFCAAVGATLFFLGLAAL